MARDDIRSRRNYPKLGTRKKNLEGIKHLTDKFIADSSRGKNTEDSLQNKIIDISKTAIDQLSRKIGQDKADAENIFQILPDIELNSEILIASTLSPTDMINEELTFSTEEFESELAGPLLEVMKDYWKKEYRIDEKLEGMLENIHFKKGSHILVVIPETQVDQIINAGRSFSAENYNSLADNISFENYKGFISKNPTVGSISGTNILLNTPALKGNQNKPFNSGIKVTDNFDVLKKSKIKTKARELKIASLTDNKYSVEDFKTATRLTDKDIEKIINGKRSEKVPSHVVIPSDFMEVEETQHPLVLTLPPESVIPVIAKGDPENKLGIFLIVDKNGRPVEFDSETDYYTQLKNGWGNNNTSTGQDSSSELIRRTREAINGLPDINEDRFDSIFNSYATIIENDLFNRLRNGLYGEDVEIKNIPEFYSIMLYRAWKEQETNIVFIPAEYVTYMAFKVDKRGIGIALPNKSKAISAFRSTLMFADVMSGVRNAIGRKKVTIRGDADDPDFVKTVSDTQGLVIEGQRRGLPVVSPDPGQTMDYLARAGIDFNVEAEGDNHPTTNISFDDYNTQVSAGNEELQERLRRMQSSSMGMMPEWTDPNSTPEFAVSVINNNLLMARRILKDQVKFCRFLARFMKIFTRFSGKLRAELEEVVTKNAGMKGPVYKGKNEKEIVNAFINSFTVKLPKPDTQQLEQQSNAFDNYNNLLIRRIESIITDEIFDPDVLQRDPGIIDKTIKIITAHFQREWFVKNDVLPEVNVLTEMDGNKPVFDMFDVHLNLINSLGTSIHNFVDKEEKLKEKWAKKYGLTEEDMNPEDTISDNDNAFGDTPEEDIANEEEEDLDQFSLDEEPESEEEEIPQLEEEKSEEIPKLEEEQEETEEEGESEEDEDSKKKK